MGTASRCASSAKICLHRAAQEPAQLVAHRADVRRGVRVPERAGGEHCVDGDVVSVTHGRDESVEREARALEGRGAVPTAWVSVLASLR